MPIEFYCPGCGNLMRTPDETAGRKGRCPTCQLKVQIPAGSIATTSESAVARTAVFATTKRSGPEPIRFDCGSCGKTLSIAAANAGKKGQCPHCGELMSIPLKSSTPGERWKGAPKQKAKTLPARAEAPTSTRQPVPAKAGGGKIEFHCSNCREVVRVGVVAAGKRGQCPRCKAVIQIPHESTSVPGLQPLPSGKPATVRHPQGKPAASDSGLTTLPFEPSPRTTPGTPGLTPLPNNAPASPGFAPLDDGGLSALEPLGLTPLGPDDSEAQGIDSFASDLFVGSQADDGNPFARGAAPRAARAAGSARPARRRTENRSGAEIATMICGIFLALYAVVHLVTILVTFVGGTGIFVTPPDMQERLDADSAFATGYAAGQFIAAAVGGLAMLTMLVGGITMTRFKAWGLCLAACILTMMPCSCLCFVGLPIGIWGTVMLSLGPVRSAFR